MVDPECPIIDINIENGYGIALLKECMTDEPFKRWKDGCRVTYKCLHNHILKGNTTVVCKDSKWSDEPPSCKYSFIYYAFHVVCQIK